MIHRNNCTIITKKKIIDKKKKMSETKSTKKGKIMIRIKTMNSTTYELIADRGASIASLQPEIEQV